MQGVNFRFGGGCARLTGVEMRLGITAHLYAKQEHKNPSGSIKDRAADAIIRAAEGIGELKVGDTILEASSGNMGISLALIGKIRGYRVKIFAPEGTAKRKLVLMKKYGADVILTERADGMAGAIRAMQREGGGFFARQFERAECVDCHYEGTGRELIREVGEPLCAFVGGVGTGGCLMGVGRRVKESYAEAQVIAVEPMLCPVLSGGEPGIHGIEGIGAGFMPPLYDASLVDGVIGITDEEARECQRLLMRYDGIFGGISTGASLAAAIKLARRGEGLGAIAFTVNDGGERYL